MTVGERIKALRKKLGLSQVDFADRIAVSKQTLYKYENNIIANIPFDKIEAAARLGNVSPAYLMGWEQIDAHLSGREVSADIYNKFNANIEKHHGPQKELTKIYEKLSAVNQERVLSYSRKLLDIQQEEEEILATHARTDIAQSSESVQQDLDLMDDDNKWE